MCPVWENLRNVSGPLQGGIVHQEGNAIKTTDRKKYSVSHNTRIQEGKVGLQDEEEVIQGKRK